MGRRCMWLTDDAEGQWEYTMLRGKAAHETLCDGDGINQVYTMYAGNGLDDPQGRWAYTIQAGIGADNPWW